MSLNVCTEFLDKQLAIWKGNRPIVLGISGPQGSGKSYLAHHLELHVHEKHPELSCVGLSIDDFYLSHKEQEVVSEEARRSGNFLMEGRGLPGTHDLQLAIDTLNNLITRKIPTNIPRYDKSAFEGEGDRLPKDKWQIVEKPVDVIVFEGWFLGYRSIDPVTFPSVYLSHESNEVLQGISMHHLEDINFKLCKYERLWNFIDCSVILSTSNIDNVYTWRLQQESELIKKSGSGMSEATVAEFVRRYMPIYYLYYETFVADGISGKGTNLVLSIGLKRNVKQKVLR